MSLELTAQRLREVLTYDSDTGQFRWRVTLSHRAVAGKVAGCTHRAMGCIYIGIGGRLFKAHRLAWLYVHGHWPAAGIDHINGNPGDNRLSNLREATQLQNMQNLWRAPRRSSTGLLGAQRCGDRYIARLKAGDITVISIKFDTPQEAHSAYMQFKAIFHPFGAVALS